MEENPLALARLSAANAWLRDEIARLRLTDEEREAIEFKAAYCVTVADQMHQRCAATLRGLLERTK